MSVVIYLLVAGILGCVFAMIVVAMRGGSEKPPPPLQIRPLLSKREMHMYRDLSSIAPKIGIIVLAKVPLSHLVEPKEEQQREKIKKRLESILIPFVLGEEKSTQLLMAVLPADFRDEFATSVLDQAKVAYLQINNYNIPGLEKAIREKIAGQGKQKIAATPENVAFTETPEPEKE